MLRYNPKTGKVDVLARNIWFANGITVDKDESFIMISESSMGRVLQYHLKGPKEEQLEVMVDNLPAMVDGATCSFESGKCYAPMPSPPIPLMKLLEAVPESVAALIRTLLMMLPASVMEKIKPVPYGGVVEISPGDGYSESKITKIFQDPHGEMIGFITGLSLDGNLLYMGSLTNNFVGVFDLSDH